MIRNTVYKKVGGYREWFDRIGNEDYDWSARIVESFKSKNIPEFLYFVRQTEGSISRAVKNPRQLISFQIVQQLILQRKEGGSDFLDNSNTDGLNKFENLLLIPFIKDPSLVYRKSSDIYWYNANIKQYLISSIKAVYSRPFSFLNWKYCILSFYRYIEFYLFSFRK